MIHKEFSMQKEKMQIYLPPRLKKRLKYESEKTFKSMSFIIREALELYFNHRNRAPGGPATDST